jgi:hypothetical protein
MADPSWPQSWTLDVDGSAGRMKGGSMPRDKVCYFTVIRRGAEIIAVRFGFSCRMNSQIETTDANWREIATRLQEQGIRLVECPDGTSGAPGVPEQAGLQRISGFSVRFAHR